MLRAPVTGARRRPGCWLMTSHDINDVRDGLEMVRAATTLKQSTVVLLTGTERKEVVHRTLGTTLRYVPLEEYLSTYKSMKITEPMRTVLSVSTSW